MQELAAQQEAAKPQHGPKVVRWEHFCKFINNQDYWNRWDYAQNLAEESEYFIQALEDVKNNVPRSHYDFDLCDPQVFSKEGVNWEHDGEGLFYFFEAWFAGKRI